MFAETLKIGKRMNHTDLIIDLNLSKRSFNALSNVGIITLQNLLDYPKENFYQIKNLGQKSIDEILNIIDSFNKQFINTITPEKETSTFLNDLEFESKIAYNLSQHIYEFIKHITSDRDSCISNLSTVCKNYLDEQDEILTPSSLYLDENSFWSFIYKSEYIIKIFSYYISNELLTEKKCTFEELKNSMPVPFKCDDFINTILTRLQDNKQILVNDEFFYVQNRNNDTSTIVMQDNYSFDDSICKLELSNRTTRCLNSIGIETIQDLIECPKNDIKNIQSMGSKSLAEINEVIIKIEQGLLNISYEINNTSLSSMKKTMLKDGQEYFDIRIEDLSLSNRAYNTLKNYGIEYYSSLLATSNTAIQGMSNIGEKTLNEIIRLKENNIELEAVDKERRPLQNHSLCLYMFSIFKNYILITYKDFTKHVLPVCDVYKEIESEEFPKLLYERSFILQIIELSIIKNAIKSKILASIKERKYGFLESEILDIFPSYLRIEKYFERVFMEMQQDNQIKIFDKNKYIPCYESFMSIKNLLPQNHYDIFIKRTKGATLEELGLAHGFSRERIRQIEALVLKKIEGMVFKEDIYKDIFEKYKFSADDFRIAFKDLQTYFYLDIRYTPTKGHPKQEKLPLNEILESNIVPKQFLSACEKAIYKNYVKIHGAYILCTRTALCDYVLRTYAKDEITSKKFFSIYASILQEIGHSNNESLLISERYYEMRLAASNKTLWKQGRVFRYYNSNLYDMAELFETLNLEQYVDVEYSTLKFIRMYPELMQEFDIRDEYELHNLLKKNCNKENYPHITFNRMPCLTFGKADREKQIINLLFSLAPVSAKDFAEAYENEYGVAKGTIIANYLQPLHQYFDGQLYRTDLKVPSNDEIDLLQNVLKNDFYTIRDAASLLKNHTKNTGTTLLHPFPLKKIGYRYYTNYIVRDSYSSVNEYTQHLLLKNSTIDISTIPNELKSTIAFNTTLQTLKSHYKIVEFSPGKYVSSLRLQEFSTNKEQILEYITSVLNFIEQNEYFTIHLLKKRGFTHKLDELGFDDWFYTSLLIEMKESISYQRIGYNKIMLSSGEKFTIVDFIENIIMKQNDFSINIYDLTDFLLDLYNVRIEKQKIIEIIKDSSLFYSPVTQKIYIDYDTYYEEI